MTHAKHPEITRILLLALSLMFACTTSLADSANKIYKWADQNGDIQYTQFPTPPGIQVLEIRSVPPPADNPDAERAKLQQEVEALDERMAERQEAAARAELLAKNEEIRKQNCITARNNLSKLSESGGKTRFLMPDGKVVRMTEEDRQKQIAETKAQIAENCKN
jgi:hypothetical protein